MGEVRWEKGGRAAALSRFRPQVCKFPFAGRLLSAAHGARLVIPEGSCALS
jgi:hypothetical protein